MKDCSKTEIYLQEKNRMCKPNDSCYNCPFYEHRIDSFSPCNSIEDNYPLKAMEIVQKWSDEHPDTNKVKIKRVRAKGHKDPKGAKGPRGDICPNCRVRGCWQWDPETDVNTCKNCGWRDTNDA